MVDYGTFTEDEIDESEYFAKNYVKDAVDHNVVSLDLGPKAGAAELEDSMNESLRPNHFDDEKEPKD